MLILIKFGPENPAERWKLTAANAADQVLLLQNGVFWAASEPEALAGKNVAIVLADWQVRGYAAERCPWPLVDYAGLIELIEQNPKSMA